MVPRSGGEPSGVDKSAVESLENQLASTQALLAAHVERIKGCLLYTSDAADE